MSAKFNSESVEKEYYLTKEQECELWQIEHLK